MESIKINDILVCEDIRTEIGGKHTIVGLVSELNATIPVDIKGNVNVPLSFMLRFSNLKNDLKLKYFTVIIYSEGKEIVKRKITLKEGKEIQRHFNIALVKENIIIPDSTELGFSIYVTDMRDNEHEIKTDYKFKINLNRK
jgi:hypothetical protein